MDVIVIGVNFSVTYAARSGHLEILKWARANGCDWDKFTYVEATRGGHLEVLQWAHDNGCPRDVYTCKNAAEFGQFEILKWALANGYAYNDEICYYAAMHGNFVMLKFLVEYGCPIDWTSCSDAANISLAEKRISVALKKYDIMSWDKVMDNISINTDLEMIQWLKLNIGDQELIDTKELS